MRRIVAVLFLAFLATACSHGHGKQQAMPTATPSTAPTPAFRDLDNISAALFIDQLTQLQIFWPPGGLFEPQRPVLRREFVRWLMHADAAIWASNPAIAIAPASTDAKPYFVDVPVNDPDFAAIEGMQDAGIPIGFPDRHFRPNDPITREQALAVKAYVDCGAPDPLLSGDVEQAYYELPHWRDAHDISRAYVAAIGGCLLDDQGTTPEHQLNTIGRTFGATDTLEPQRPLDRAEAAAMIWKIGERKPDLTNFPPRSAADALIQ